MELSVEKKTREDVLADMLQGYQVASHAQDWTTGAQYLFWVDRGGAVAHARICEEVIEDLMDVYNGTPTEKYSDGRALYVKALFLARSSCGLRMWECDRHRYVGKLPCPDPSCKSVAIAEYLKTVTVDGKTFRRQKVCVPTGGGTVRFFVWATDDDPPFPLRLREGDAMPLPE